MFPVKCSRHRRPWRLLFLLFCLCFVSPFVHPARTLAAADPITVLSQSDQVTFPKGIDFQITASDSNSTITQAVIFIKYESIDGYQEQHQISPHAPATMVTLTWHENTTGDSFAPTGTRISYYWQLLDSAGNVHTDRAQNFTLVDTRFNWQHASQGLFQVNWYNRSPDFGQTVLNQAESDIQHISADLGGQITHPLSLWVYQTNDDFRGSLPPDEHEWVGGIAFPRLNVASIVVQDLEDDTLTRDMPHELTHLVFHQLINNIVPPPVWFDEGLAVYHQLYHEPQMMLIFKKALAKQSLLRLNDIAEGFPADPDKAYLAYAQSWNLVDYMYRTFDHARMVALFHKMTNAQTTFDQDLQAALGIDQAHLENQWHLSLNQPSTLSAISPVSTPLAAPQPVQVTATDSSAPLFMLIGILLVMLPGLGIGYLFVSQRRTRQKNLALQQAAMLLNQPFPPTPQSPYRGPHTPLPYTSPARYASPTPQPPTLYPPYAQQMPYMPPHAGPQGQLPQPGQDDVTMKVPWQKQPPSH